MSNEANWHLLTAEGEQTGPYTGEEFLAFAGEGRISPESLVWAEGLEDWVPAAQVEGLFPSPQAGAPRLITGAGEAAVPAQAAAAVSPVAAPVAAPVVGEPQPSVSLAGGSTGAQEDAFVPALVGPLRLVTLGLGFLLWGTWLIAGGLVLVIVGALSAYFGAASSGSGEGGMFGLIALVGGVGLILVGCVLKIIGASISIAVPSASGARGFMIACLCCEAGGLLISLLGVPLGGLLNSAGLVLMALFLRKLATFTGNMVQAIAGRSLIIHSAIFIGLSVTLPILLILVFGAGLAIGMFAESGLAGLGVGAILLLLLLAVTLFFALSVLFRSIGLFRGLRTDIKSRCFRTMAAMRHARTS